jgi:hypothetical protein
MEVGFEKAGFGVVLLEGRLGIKSWELGSERCIETEHGLD